MFSPKHVLEDTTIVTTLNLYRYHPLKFIHHHFGGPKFTNDEPGFEKYSQHISSVCTGNPAQQITNIGEMQNVNIRRTEYQHILRNCFKHIYLILAKKIFIWT